MRSSLLMFFTAICVSTVGHSLQFTAHAQQRADIKRADISGGAALIFSNPPNPEYRSRIPTKQDVDDAIKLGNAARDQSPPDFESAERAYRLAWKLDRDDPRPHVGLGNIYWEQRRYTDAAREYKEAIKLMTPDPEPVRVSRSSRRRPRSRSGNEDRSRELSPLAQSHLYLAAALLNNQDPIAGERELRAAVSLNSYNAELHEIFGQFLYSENRFSEAQKEFEDAVRLDNENEKFKESLEQSRQKARAASVNDQTMTSQLINTNWSVRGTGKSTFIGTCRLQADGVIRCTSISRRFSLEDVEWKVMDGLFYLKLNYAFRSRCIGHLEDQTINMKCPVDDFEGALVWRKTRGSK